MNTATDDNQKQTISDDQELAKVLAGVAEETDKMSYEETGNPPGTAPVPEPADTSADVAPVPTPVAPAPEVTPSVDPIAPVGPVGPVDTSLDDVKQAAINELRPLIDKLDVSPEEKFSTYLLLIRSTDDKELVAPAHEAAKGIADEAKKAQALLDIIKEIDFLSQPKQ